MDDVEKRHLAQENLVLLVLGEAMDKEMSMLHLEKEIFLLWNFHPKIKAFVDYVPYKRGPYSEAISYVIHSPYFRTNQWTYTPPKKSDKYSSGYIRLTENGKREYKELYDRMIKNETMQSVIAGISIVRALYDRYTPEELIYLVYRGYENYTTESEVKREIFAREDYLLRNIQKIKDMDPEMAGKGIATL